MKNRFKFIAGVDEAGRGALCGPVVAACVVIADYGRFRRTGKWRQVRDSKLLSPANREELAEFLRDEADDFGIGMASHHEIDKLNIHHASLLAMRRAVKALRKKPQIIFVDGRFIVPEISISQKAIIDGDETNFLIAAASIIAKVHRDNLMIKLAKKFPAYGFDLHKGYATHFHRKSLKKYGPCAIHRKSFSPVKKSVKSGRMKLKPN